MNRVTTARARRRRAAAAVTAVMALGACNGGDTADDAAPTTAADVTTTTVPPTTTTLPADPVEAFAFRILTAESVIRDPASPPDELARYGQAQQVAYRELVEQADLLPRVLERLPGELRPVAEANVEAGVKLRRLTPPRTEQPPAHWRIVEPAPADELLGYYRAAEAEFNVPWPYLAAIHLVETRMGRIDGVSSAGAQGPMQFLPSTWAAYGEGDIRSNRDAIRAAARYLVRNGAPHDMRNALFNYNRSFLYVDAVAAYAHQMVAAERAFYGYYHWQVYYRTIHGDVLLPVGWPG